MTGYTEEYSTGEYFGMEVDCNPLPFYFPYPSYEYEFLPVIPVIPVIN